MMLIEKLETVKVTLDEDGSLSIQDLADYSQEVTIPKTDVPEFIQLIMLINVLRRGAPLK